MSDTRNIEDKYDQDGEYLTGPDKPRAMTNEELLQQAKDQVIKRINKPGIKSWSDIQAYDEWTQFELHDEAAKLAIQSAREEAAPKWIPVTERIPEREPGFNTSKVVLVTIEGRESEALAFYNYAFNKWSFDFHIGAPVTEWMPIPKKN